MAPGDGVEEGKQIPGSWCLSRAEGAYGKKKSQNKNLILHCIDAIID